MRGKNRCYVCFTKHDKGEYYKFPDDMPYKFRWCCICMNYADVIIRTSFERIIKNYRKHHGVIKSFFFIQKGKRLIKLMKVV